MPCSLAATFIAPEPLLCIGLEEAEFDERLTLSSSEERESRLENSTEVLAAVAVIDGGCSMPKHSPALSGSTESEVEE